MRVFIGCLILLLFACPYQDPFEETENTELLSGQNLTNWNYDYGITVVESAESGPGNKTAWDISMVNLIQNDDFETTNAGGINGDLSNWTQDFSSGSNSSVNAVKQSNSENYRMYLKIGDKIDNMYQSVTIDKTIIIDSFVNLCFRFSYENLTSIGIQVSYGTANADISWLDKDISESNGFASSGNYLYPFTINLGSNAGTTYSFNIRIGSKNTEENGREFEAYFDNVALYYQNNNSIYKVFSPSNGFVQTGSYEFSVYAKLSSNADISSKLACLYLFAKPKDITVTDSWQQFSIKAKYTGGDFKLAISPTVYNTNNRYPGLIIISSPSLTFHPNENFE